MLLKLVKMNKGTGPFVQVKPYQVKMTVGEEKEIPDAHAYKLMGDFPGMFAPVVESRPVEKMAETVANKSMEGREKAKNRE